MPTLIRCGTFATGDTLTSISMASPSFTAVGALETVATGTDSSSTNVRSMAPPMRVPPRSAVSACVVFGWYWTPEPCGALISRLALDWPARMVMVSLPPSP